MNNALTLAGHATRQTNALSLAQAITDLPTICGAGGRPSGQLIAYRSSDLSGIRMVHAAVWKRLVEGPRLDIDGGGPVVLQHAGCGQDINDVREWHVPGGQLPD